MADDRLIFPIGFDLENGIDDAIKEWETASKKIEDKISKKPIGVSVNFDTKSLDALQKRLKKIKIAPISDKTKASIRELATKLRTLAKALEAVQKVKDLRASADPSAVRAARIAEVTKRTDDKHEESLIRQRKLTAQAEAAEARRKKAVEGTTKEYRSQYSYLQRLTKRMAVYWSVSQVSNFLTKVREVTAQFELQRVSLGAIIQDQTKANALFSEIKSFALKSPISVMDLTTYTKQVAAYRIETDKLFDTTKRLADVSVGLGVDMGRLVLAYGQVKAASYLRAAEIRQFTEAGIPMLELLAEKFTALNGTVVSTEEVMDMVSKRMVSFSMVEQIFNDMTSAGGMFYNMQEKQSQTLFGMWAKLGDAASIMYDEIGNTAGVNIGMKTLIQLLTDLMNHWSGLANTIQVAAIGFLMHKSLSLASKAIKKFNSETFSLKKTLTSLGKSMLNFLPTAIFTVAATLVDGLVESYIAQWQALKKVAEKHREMLTTLLRIENAYKDVEKAARSATVSEEEFAKGSFSQKLEQLQKLRKLLDTFGLQNTIDLSIVNYENIDPIFNSWMEKLKNVNDLARNFGAEVAKAYTAFEGNLLGWSIFGENLEEDMKDLERSWKNLTVNREFTDALEQMRVEIGNLRNENTDIYDNISKAIGADAQLALSQKRRNESELQYQQRIYKNYIAIAENLRNTSIRFNYKELFVSSTALEDAQDRMSEFQDDLAEVYHELEDAFSRFKGEDALTVKMAIDTVAAEKNWTDWQKELLIQELNKNPITLNAEIIPLDTPAATKQVAEGLKAIVTSEFPTLFNENELSSLVSVDGIVDAIKSKLDASNKSLEQSVTLQNNLAYGSKGFENSLSRIKKLQDEITEVELMRGELQGLEAIQRQKTDAELMREAELRAKLQDVDEAELNSKRDQIAAIVEANAKYEEQITKQRESAEAEREIAKAALERVTSMGLSSLGKDIKQQFGDLMVDAVKAVTDLDYSTDFLMSDEELKKIRDIGDATDWWFKNTKAVNEEIEKVKNAGISEATMAKERAQLEADRAEIKKEEAEIEAQLAEDRWKAQKDRYTELKTALAQATTAEAQRDAQKELNDFLGNTLNAEFAILMLRKEALAVASDENTVAQQANEVIKNNLQHLYDVQGWLKEFGKRYNLTLPETTPKGGTEQDPWILLMKNRMKFMQDFQKGVEDLNKFMGKSTALSTEQENMLGRGLSLKIDSRNLQGTREELVKWYEDSIEEIRKRIAKMGGKEWSGLGVQMILAKDTKNRVIKQYQELLADLFKELTDFRIDKIQQDLEAKLKQLSEEVAKSKAAREFFDKMLAETGDVDIATSITVSVYSESGADLFKRTVEQIKAAFQSENVQVGIELDSAIDSKNEVINYQKLAEVFEKYKSDLIESNRDLAKKIIENGQSEYAKQIETWQKELAKAKDYEQKRTDIIKTETERRASIIKSNLPEEQKNALLEQSRTKERQDLSALGFQEFKSSDDYIKIFEDLDNISMAGLKRLREEMQKIIDTDKDLSPQNMKELVKSMEKIDEQIQGRGFGNAMIESVREYVNAAERLKNARQKLATAKAQYEQKEPELDKEITDATDRKIAAEKNLLALKASENSSQEDILAAELEVNAATQEVALAMERKRKESRKVVDAEREVTEEQDKQKKAIRKFNKDLGTVQNMCDLIASALSDTKDLLNISSDSAAGIAFDSAIEGLERMSKLITLVTTLQEIFNLVTMSNPWLAIAAAVIAAISILSSYSVNKNAAKMDKIIKGQERIIKSLERAYDKLKDQIDKTFGGEYVENYNTRLKNLQQQAVAYQKQYRAEMNKGKKKDEDKADRYLESYRDTLDEIEEIKATEISEKMFGTDLSSAAVDFANAWLDAYISFGDTADAIAEKYNEMLKSMIVQNVLAEAVQAALSPFFDKIKEYTLSDNKLEDWEMTDIANDAVNSAESINGMLTSIVQRLKQAGLDVRDLGETADDTSTGIKRDIATASEESINGLAVGINTQNFYIAQIHANVAMIAQKMSGGGEQIDTASNNQSLTLQHLSYLPTIAQNTAETVARCERAAIACEEMATQIGRVIKPRGVESQYVMNIN